MNQKPSQSRLPASRRHAKDLTGKALAGADCAATSRLLSTASTIKASPAIAQNREQRDLVRSRRSSSAIKPLGRTLGQRDGALYVFSAGGVVGKHVDYEEIGDRGGGLLAERAEARRRQRALGHVAVRR